MTGLVGAVRSALGAGVVDVDPGFGPVTIDVSPSAWVPALVALSESGATFFDFLTAYDELQDGFAVVAHVSTPDAADHVLLRTRVPRRDPVLASATGVYAGAAWHERETHEMFGVEFEGNDRLDPLLLQPGFQGRPLRKDFVLASRVVAPWPGTKEPGESASTPSASGRRRVLPPGVPADWPRPPADGPDS
jgi:NADH-quinone oxidoreductase subunit C